MSDIDIKIERESTRHEVKIKVVGIGGGGTNMINRIVQDHSDLPITLIAMNTDANHLENSLPKVKLQLGEELTKGLGAGMDPEVGEKAALESEEQIKALLKDTDIVLLVTALGGGTGTGATPIVANVAKSMGILTISMVTFPFEYEGVKKEKRANRGLEIIEQYSDCVIVILNDKLLTTIDRSVGTRGALQLVNDVVVRGVNALCSMITSNNTGDVHIDFADLKKIMEHKGKALMGISEKSGENSALQALKEALESPLLEEVTINSATGVLIHFLIHPDYPLLDMTAATQYIKGHTAEEVDFKWGMSIDEGMDISCVKVTVIATGFSHNHPRAQHHTPYVDPSPISSPIPAPISDPIPEPVLEPVLEPILEPAVQEERFDEQSSSLSKTPIDEIDTNRVQNDVENDISDDIPEVSQPQVLNEIEHSETPTPQRDNSKHIEDMIEKLSKSDIYDTQTAAYEKVYKP